jgi:hypothetical protein
LEVVAAAAAVAVAHRMGHRVEAVAAVVEWPQHLKCQSLHLKR